MYCKYCGNEIPENTTFCKNCGNQLLYETVDSNETPAPQRTRGFASTIIKKAVLIAAVIAVLITGIVFFTKTNSLDKKLMQNGWWEEIQFDNEPRAYDDSYWVTAKCHRITFCPSGNVREDKFHFGWGAYELSYEVNAENMPSNFSFPEVSSYNDYYWELLDGKELLYNDNYYEWSSTEDDDTWYLKGDTLRIGDTYYTTKNPGVKVDNDFDEIPYWCANCGQKGPYNETRCPNCDSKEKIKFDF